MNSAPKKTSETLDNMEATIPLPCLMPFPCYPTTVHQLWLMQRVPECADNVAARTSAAEPGAPKPDMIELKMYPWQPATVSPIPVMQAIIVSSSKLPNGHKETFPSSTFFRQGTEPQQLPTPAEVRAQATLKNHARINTWCPPPVVFPDVNLLVKYGGAVSIGESQCLGMIRTYLGHEIPVPEVYGWCRDDEETFIYMELIRGSTLEERWDELSTTQRSNICDQLRPMVAALRALK